MTSHLPFQWNNPSAWPWPVWIWVAIVLASFLRPAWKWFQRTRGAAWPLASGTIEATSIYTPGFSFSSRKPKFIAQVHYKYLAAGIQGEGLYSRGCYTEQEANDFVRDLEGLPVDVHYNPSNPAQAAILDSDIDAVLVRRTPGAADTALPESSWNSVLLQFLATLACVGLVVSLWVHIGAVSGRRVAPEGLFFLLHVGVIVIWFPAILLARNMIGSTARRDLWKAMFAGSPSWLRYMVYGFGAYAMLNFSLFMLHAPTGKQAGSDPPAEVWRGFSGHWMAFYSAAFAIFYAVLERKRPRDQRP